MAYARTSDGIRVHYEVLGRASAPPVLMIQGLGADKHGWDMQRYVFAAKYRVIALDNRGAGRSDKPFGHYSLEQMADDAIAVLDACGVDSAHVIGASMGGAISQIVAVKYPERVRSLTLVCTACRNHPWRRELLEGLDLDDADMVDVPAAFEGDLDAALASSRQLGLEGVVAKRASSPYRSTRSRDWLKMKSDPEADFAICGYTPPKGSRNGIGALHWIEPELVVQVRYREWPVDSALRFPVFVRLRPDKTPHECGMPLRHTGEGGGDGEGDLAAVFDEPVVDDRPAIVPDPDLFDPVTDPVDDTDPGRLPDASALEVDAPIRELRLTRLHKVFWPEEQITKGELIEYYRAVAPAILPYLKDRPTVLTRYPDGITGEMFFQKDMPGWIPPWLRTTTLWSEHSQREIHYVLVDDADGLAYVANLGSIPIHCWASRTTSLEKPDWAIVDLDPKNAPREWVVPLALAIHALCDDVKLPNYVKTSGQSGLHVLIPLGGQCTFEQARTLAYLIGLLVERQHPDMATTNRNPAARGGRVYLDWGQNAHGQLLVAPYSVRPVAGAPVSMPLEWPEVVPDLDPKVFHLRNALARIAARAHDPCLPVLDERPDLAAALVELERHAKDG
ncbi:MAG: non-homologous end-joining DNA ligase [Proteobacteria bacterium]|nr:non-homologous end-joining DNA ligase [Pseudomonadota bacterium]